MPKIINKYTFEKRELPYGIGGETEAKRLIDTGEWEKDPMDMDLGTNSSNFGIKMPWDEDEEKNDFGF